MESKLIAGKVFNADGHSYEAVVYEEAGEVECVVKLLPQGPLLFQSSLEWLEYSCELEDGDAVHKMPFMEVIAIGKWARENGFTGSSE